MEEIEEMKPVASADGGLATEGGVVREGTERRSRRVEKNDRRKKVVDNKYKELGCCYHPGPSFTNFKSKLAQHVRKVLTPIVSKPTSPFTTQLTLQLYETSKICFLNAGQGYPESNDVKFLTSRKQILG